VFGELGIVRSIITAALMALFAESCQVVMMYRDPSFMDVTANVIGGIPVRFIEPPDVR
jgi:glycopeptide antibiotics resistance protein